MHSLLDFAKPTPLKLKDTDIHNLIEETLVLLSNDFLQKKITLIKKFNCSNPVLRLDAIQIKQAFLNIILNAIEAMPQGGTLSIKTQDKSPNQVEIIFKDTGTGISSKNLVHIFEPFYSTREKGTGLGLSIVHSIIQAHKGKIEVESQVGKGTTFMAKLPIDKG